jgi:hypothetical protein
MSDEMPAVRPHTFWRDAGGRYEVLLLARDDYLGEEQVVYRDVPGTNKARVKRLEDFLSECRPER